MIDPIKNINYTATVIAVPPLEKLDELDNLVALRALGMQALVPVDTEEGSLGVLFSTEVQLSEAFCRANNLYRHSEKNDDINTKGYLEDNRRVKAIKLRGVRSDSLFLPLSSLSYTGLDLSKLKPGDVFDSLAGQEICRKYVVREPAEFRGTAPKIRRVDLKQFPMHSDTENWWRNKHKLPEHAALTVTQKLHGTSVRYGNILIDDQPVGRIKRLFRRLAGVPEVTQSYHFVVGSRTVVKSIDLSSEDGKQHYYGQDDIWTQYAEAHRLADVIPRGYLVYGELVGYTPTGRPIQPGYTYGLPEGQARLYVYRVAVATPDGKTVDLSWPAVQQFCKDRGLLSVPTFFTDQYTPHTEWAIDILMDRRYADEWTGGFMEFADGPVPLSDEKTVDEGVCIRYDGPDGVFILKAKSPQFLAHESKMLDTAAEDTEAGEQ